MHWNLVETMLSRKFGRSPALPKSVWFLFILLLVSGCRQTSPATESSPESSSQTETPAAAAAAEKETAVTEPTFSSQPGTSVSDESQVIYAFTHQRVDGNRLVGGRGAFPEAEVLDIELEGKPAWIVAAPLAEGTIWVAALEDGRLQAFHVLDGQVNHISIEPATIGQLPPVLKIDGGLAEVLVPAGEHSEYSSLVGSIDQETQAFIKADGSLALVDQNGLEIQTIAVNALPDSRLLLDELERILFLSGPTSIYDHGILGDEIEASSITLVSQQPQAAIESVIDVTPGDVIEGLMPLWTDLNDDGEREIIVTQSNSAYGARIVVYDESGTIIAEGPSVGQGYRWRHQIAAGPFGPAGEIELVDVLTPHIGGVVEFYRLVGDRLVVTASVPGFTSHVIGSRNLDMAVGGDFDGDSNLELLLPDQARMELGAIRRTTVGAEVAWAVPIGGRLVTNLAAVELADGRLAVGAGREDGTLRIWLP